MLKEINPKIACFKDRLIDHNPMKTVFTLLSVFSFALLTGCQSIPQADDAKGTSTGWLPLAQFNAELARLEKKQNGKNFWDEGHWVTSVDGRWNNGIAEYRMSYAEVPENEGYWWYWWFNQEESSFEQRKRYYSDEGFTMVHSQSYLNPEGEKRYQGVWHKIYPKN
ncbi:hypothetical protein DDZ13_09395 [Coraliomargarita sinensis]|uniref:Uncharacterized protein n=2 Tax=Coraliomargarita sinensis TaxID=2174842 RepID=A0A317ZHR5_9BACT|nr:hypothetical protein DDZ13_09395 [Coraliomargarita sinensis]